MYGYGFERREVFGGFTYAQWVTILTGECPTSSVIGTPLYGSNAYKACPK